MIPLLSTRLHGILHYLMAAGIVAYPWIVGYSNYSYAPWVMMFTGVSMVIYGLMTRFEWGYVGLMSMQTHLVLDILAGLLLIAAPWLFEFENIYYTPLIISGAVVLAIALLTKPKAKETHGPQLSPKSPGRPPEKVHS